MIREPEVRRIGENGTLRVCRTDRFKAGILSVAFVMPITARDACLAPLMLSVLRRGTEKYPSLAQINRRLDELYGTGFSIRPFYRGNRLVLSFRTELLDETYLPGEKTDIAAGVAELLEQMLFHPLLENGQFCERYVESEKELQCDAIRSLQNNPRQYAAEHAKRILYENEPAGIPLLGSEEETRAVTVAELTDYWKKWLTTLCPDCFYLGPMEPERVADLLLPICSNPASANATPILGYTDTPPILSAKTVKRREETLAVSQGQLLVGLRTGTVIGTPEDAVCDVMNELLGMSPVSLLFMNVREKLSLCYSVSSSFNPFLGTVTVFCGLAVANRERAETEIFRQIDRLRTGDFSDDDLDAAKKSLRNGYLWMQDSPSALCGYFFSRALAGISLPAEERLAAFDRVTREEIMSLAARLTVDTVYFLRGTLEGGDADESDDV